MRRLLIATHGRFAEGIKETLNFILGQTQAVDVICAYVEPDFDMDRVAKEQMEALSEQDELIAKQVCRYDQLILFGGSVANKFSEYISNGNVYVITGMNLPLLIELTGSLEDDRPVEEIIAEAIESAKEGIVNVNQVLGEALDTEEDDF